MLGDDRRDRGRHALRIVLTALADHGEAGGVDGQQLDVELGLVLVRRAARIEHAGDVGQRPGRIDRAVDANALGVDAPGVQDQRAHRFSSVTGQRAAASRSAASSQPSSSEAAISDMST